MHKSTLALLMASIVGVFGASINSFAGGGGGMSGGATEVTQLANNAQLAMQSIQEEMTFVQTQMNTYYNMLQQAQYAVGAFSINKGDLIQKYQSAMGFYNQLNGLYGSVQNMRELTNQRMNTFAATGLDWNTYVAREKATYANQQDRYSFLTNQERSAIDTVKQNYDSIASYQDMINGTMGTHGSMRVMNAQMNTLLGQMNQVIERSAVSSMVDASQKQDDLARRKATQDAGNRSAYNNSLSVKGMADQLTGRR